MFTVQGYVHVHVVVHVHVDEQARAGLRPSLRLQCVCKSGAFGVRVPRVQVIVIAVSFVL